MCSAALLILHAAFVAQTRAHTNSVDSLVDTLVDKLSNKLLGSQLFNPRMTNAFLSPYSRSVTPVQGAQNKLRSFGIGPNPLESLVLTTMDANNRGNRDLSLRAQQAEISSGWSTVDVETKKKLAKVLDQVKAKESLLAGITRLGYFDPLGFSTDISGGKLLFYREVELKHGRVAMLATLGILVAEQFHPLFGGDIDVPAYLAFQQTPLQSFWPAVVAAIAIPEIFSVFQFENPSEQNPLTAEYWKMKADHEPGDLGFDPLGLKPKDPKELKAMQNKELNNGRLAMIAAAGMIAQELATGQKLF
jgi:hypothetical protein